jgi:hypothetical protein
MELGSKYPGFLALEVAVIWVSSSLQSIKGDGSIKCKESQGSYPWLFFAHEMQAGLFVSQRFCRVSFERLECIAARYEP